MAGGLTHLSKSSLVMDVEEWLRERNFSETSISKFIAEDIDGKEFYLMHTWMIDILISPLKEKRQFREAWSTETGMIFDLNGKPICPPGPNSASSSTSSDSATNGTSNAHSLDLAEQGIEETEDTDQPPTDNETPHSTTSGNKRGSSHQRSIKRGRALEKDVKANWADTYELPTRFSVSVETGLNMKSLNWCQRNELVRDVCTLISINTRYPTEQERITVAKLIIATYPFLKDAKIGDTSTEWGTWEQKILWRMKRLQHPPSKRCLSKKMGEAAKDQPARKKKKHSEVWFEVPEITEEEERELQEKANELRQLSKASRPDNSKILVLMEETFPLRRQMVVENVPDVAAVQKDYPPLVKPIHFKLEMCRVMQDTSIARIMKESLVNTWIPKVLSIARNRDRPEINSTLDEMDNAITKGDITEIECQHRAAISILFNNLLKRGGGRSGSSAEMLLRVVKGTEDIEGVIKKSTCPSLVVGGEDIFNTDVIYIVAENKQLFSFSIEQRIADAIVIMLSSYFVFNFEYSIQRNVLIFLQSAMMSKVSTKLPVTVSQLFTELQKL